MLIQMNANVICQFSTPVVTLSAKVSVYVLIELRFMDMYVGQNN